MRNQQCDKTQGSLTRRGALRFMAGTAGALAAGRLAAQGASPGPTEVAVEWDRLQRQVHGRVVSRRDAGYERARESMLRNTLKPDRFPDAIVFASSEQDVQEAVRFARRQHLKVAIRGGGHSFCGSPLRQGGLLLDLSALNTLDVDPVRRMAVAQPAVQGRHLAEALTARGLAFPVGHCGTVPLSGYLLNGGIGWNSGAWGPACMSVAAIDLVNAEGESIHADPEHNADYFWAARGAGPGFFAVVTRYYLRLQAMPAVMRASTVTYRLEDVDRVGAWLPEVVRSLRPEVELNCFFAPVRPQGQEASMRPTEHAFVVSAVAFAQTPREADQWLAPVADGPQTPGRRLAACQEVSFPDLYAQMESLFVDNRRYVTDAFTFDAPPAEILTHLRDRATVAPSPESFFLLSLPSPRPADAPAPPDMAFSLPGSSFVGVYGIWREAAQDAENGDWVRQTSKQLESIKVGHYVGETDLTASAGRARQSFAPANWQRLRQLRAKYDPYNVFFDYLSPG